VERAAAGLEPHQLDVVGAAVQEHGHGPGREAGDLTVDGGGQHATAIDTRAVLLPLHPALAGGVAGVPDATGDLEAPGGLAGVAAGVRGRRVPAVGVDVVGVVEDRRGGAVG